MLSANAYIQIVTGESEKTTDKKVYFKFNPSEYSLTRELKFKEANYPDAANESKTIVQFERVVNGNFAFSAIFDSYMTNFPKKNDVRSQFIELERAVCMQGVKENLPKYIFRYGTLKYMGYINKFDVKFTMFTSTGIPVRAKVDISMKIIDDMANVKAANDVFSKMKNKATSSKNNFLEKKILNPRIGI